MTGIKIYQKWLQNASQEFVILNISIAELTHCEIQRIIPGLLVLLIVTILLL